MRTAVTGGAGFIGRSLVRQLRARGDTVVALVRDPARAGTLRELGCELVEGDLPSMPADALRAAVDGADALFHLAGSYRIGIPAIEHVAMHQANVGATRAVLDAAMAGGVARRLPGAPNLSEMVRASSGVTYWATDAKARVELGYRPRDLAAGLPTLLPSC